MTQLQSYVDQTDGNNNKIKDTPSVAEEHFRTKCYQLDDNLGEKYAREHLGNKIIQLKRKISNFWGWHSFDKPNYFYTGCPKKMPPFIFELCGQAFMGIGIQTLFSTQN